MDNHRIVKAMRRGEINIPIFSSGSGHLILNRTKQNVWLLRYDQVLFPLTIPPIVCDDGEWSTFEDLLKEYPFLSEYDHFDHTVMKLNANLFDQIVVNLLYTDEFESDFVTPKCVKMGTTIFMRESNDFAFVLVNQKVPSSKDRLDIRVFLKHFSLFSNRIRSTIIDVNPSLEETPDLNSLFDILSKRGSALNEAFLRATE